jgi:hypothetical protein
MAATLSKVAKQLVRLLIWTNCTDPGRDVRAIHEHSTFFSHVPAERDTHFRMFHQLHQALSIDILDICINRLVDDYQRHMDTTKAERWCLCADVRKTFRYEKGTTLPGPDNNARSFLMHGGLARHVSR